MPLTVHHLRQSTSERIVWLCEELGLDYTLKTYPRDPATTMGPPELKALHFTGSAPVIEDVTDAGTVTLAESAAIVQYICQRHASGQLFLPATHPEYPSFVYWLHAMPGTVSPAMSQCILAKFVRLAEQEGHGAALAQILDAKVMGLIKALDERLEKTGKWVAGEEFTAADIMVVFPLTTMRYFHQFDLGEYPAVLGYLKRVGEREAYKRAMGKADGGLEPVLGAKPPKPFLSL